MRTHKQEFRNEHLTDHRMDAPRYNEELEKMLADSGATLGSNKVRVAPLYNIRERINAAVEQIYELSLMVEDGADTLLGQLPLDDRVNGTDCPARSGVIGSIEDALDRLDDATRSLADHAKRVHSII